MKSQLSLPNRVACRGSLNNDTHSWGVRICSVNDAYTIGSPDTGQMNFGDGLVDRESKQLFQDSRI